MPDINEPQDPRPESAPEQEGRMTPESYGDPYADHDHQAQDSLPAPVQSTSSSVPAVAEPAAPPPTVPPKAEVEEDQEEDGMLRMSFLEHLEELRSRLVKALSGLGIAFLGCIFFTNQIWDAVRQPAVAALQELGYPPDLAQLTPTEAFTIIWVKLPILTGLFIASPWILYQVWAFIAPGLYKRERRLAVPFIFSTAGLFILGGVFAYFVAFRFGLVFLLGIGSTMGVRPYISLTEYTDLFVNVILGVALVFELPILIFFLTLLRLASPRFLLAHSRYAIILIVIAAAIITPTPDVMNLTIFAAPMIVLYFVGIFASYLLVLSREGRRFPWMKILYGLMVVAAAAAGLVWVATAKYGYHLIWKWPLLIK